MVERHGSGPEVLLVHGGATPRTTFAGLDPLRRRFTLATLFRRGFPPSPPVPGGGQDFELDADDIARLLAGRPHVVAHSYGGVGTMLAAARTPQLVRSLTLIETPVDLPGDGGVARIRRLAEQVLEHGLDAEPDGLREFLRLAGAKGVDAGPLPDAVVRGVERAHRTRSPYDAPLDPDALRVAGVPALVASGDHSPALERACDALAAALGAGRVVAPGAGHFVADAPGFVERLAEFLDSAA